MRASPAVVAATPELVEMILMELPLPDVLLAQRVDKTWFGVIRGSPKLQRALFLTPTSTAALRYISDKVLLDCTSAETCERKKRGSRASLVDFRSENYWAQDRDETLKHGNIVINPLIAARLPWLLGEIICGNEYTSPFKKNSMVLRPEASWKRMLLSQPPVCEIGVDLTAYHWHRVAAVAGAAGVTVDDLSRRIDSYGREMCQFLGNSGLRSLTSLSSPTTLTITAGEVLDEFARKLDGGYVQDPFR